MGLKPNSHHEENTLCYPRTKPPTAATLSVAVPHTQMWKVPNECSQLCELQMQKNVVHELCRPTDKRWCAAVRAWSTQSVRECCWDVSARAWSTQPTRECGAGRKTMRIWWRIEHCLFCSISALKSIRASAKCEATN